MYSAVNVVKDFDRAQLSRFFLILLVKLFLSLGLHISGRIFLYVHLDFSCLNSSKFILCGRVTRLFGIMADKRLTNRSFDHAIDFVFLHNLANQTNLTGRLFFELLS